MYSRYAIWSSGTLVYFLFTVMSVCFVLKASFVKHISESFDRVTPCYTYNILRPRLLGYLYFGLFLFKAELFWQNFKLGTLHLFCLCFVSRCSVCAILVYSHFGLLFDCNCDHYLCLSLSFVCDYCSYSHQTVPIILIFGVVDYALAVMHFHSLSVKYNKQDQSWTIFQKWTFDQSWCPSALDVLVGDLFFCLLVLPIVWEPFILKYSVDIIFCRRLPASHVNHFM